MGMGEKNRKSRVAFLAGVHCLYSPGCRELRYSRKLAGGFSVGAKAAYLDHLLIGALVPRLGALKLGSTKLGTHISVHLVDLLLGDCTGRKAQS
jgi:hypothetical protein